MPFKLTRFPCFSRLGLAFLAAIAVQLAQAAELGEAVVSSHIGQPLVAEIELVDTAGAVQARNANGDVYRGANIAINPALSGLTLSVQRREGRQFLRLTSARAIDANYLHLFLELVDGGKTVIRPATLWLTPDLSAPPPPPPPPSPPAQPKPQALAPPVASRTPPVPPPIVDAEPPPPVRKPARVITLGQAGPACPQPMLEQQVQACAANDEKNKALTEQVSSLEAKVKQLQALIDARTGAAPPPPLATPDAAAVSAAASAASAASAAATVPAPVPPPKKPVAPPPPAAVKKTEEGGGFPWLLVVGSVLGLAAVGGGAWFWLKRRKAKAGEAPAPQAPPDAPEPD